MYSGGPNIVYYIRNMCVCGMCVRIAVGPTCAEVFWIIIRFSKNPEKMEKTVYYIEKKKGHGSQREYYMSNPARRLYDCV